ncbi:MAG TPA: hypothetical protein VFI29_19925, partial [Hanamia sp.]|nr:hypothetical protein [Hanamia sp.]
MERFSQPGSFLQSLILNPFERLISLKSSHLRQVTLMLLFCFGGDGDFDFIDKNFVATKDRHGAYASLFSINYKPLLTSPTDYFRSRQNGTWSAPATWESSADNIAWQIATEVPTKDANTITIQSGHTISISNPVSLDQTVIEGILELQTGGVLNISDGVGDDVTISDNGVLQIVSDGNYLSSINQFPGANINISTGGKIIVGNGITPIGNGYEGLATSAINKWNDGAVYEWNNMNTFATSGLTYFPNAGTAIPIFRITKVSGTPGGSGA